MLCTNNGEPQGVLRFIWRRERESGWETEAIFSPILMLHIDDVVLLQNKREAAENRMI